MLDVLAHAERIRIVHRDIKPDNIVMDSNGDFWLLDFGIARHLDMSALTPDMSVFGKFTPGYAPAEQFRNLKDDIDGRADQFALGVTVYEMSTGTNPFIDGAADWLERCKRAEVEPLPRLSLPIKDPEGFANLVDTMTKKRRDQRCPTVAEALLWAQEQQDKENAP